jgi:hypothetical protein
VGKGYATIKLNGGLHAAAQVKKVLRRSNLIVWIEFGSSVQFVYHVFISSIKVVE